MSLHHVVTIIKNNITNRNRHFELKKRWCNINDIISCIFYPLFCESGYRCNALEMRNFNFWQKFRFFIWNLDFPPIFRFSTEIFLRNSDFRLKFFLWNFDFRPIFRFSTEIFLWNLDLRPIFRFLTEFFYEIWISYQYFDFRLNFCLRNLDFRPIISFS